MFVKSCIILFVYLRQFSRCFYSQLFQSFMFNTWRITVKYVFGFLIVFEEISDIDQRKLTEYRVRSQSSLGNTNYACLMRVFQQDCKSRVQDQWLYFVLRQYQIEIFIIYHSYAIYINFRAPECSNTRLAESLIKFNF